MKNILIVINTMGRAGAEKALISMLKSFDYSRVSVSLLAIIDRGELFMDVPQEVKILNKKYSHSPILGMKGTLYIAKKVLVRMFHKGYIFKFITYAIKNIISQLKSKHFQFDKLLWLMLAETTPRINKEYDLAIAYLEGASTYYVADRVKAKSKMAFVHVNFEKAGYNKESDIKYYEKMEYICCVSQSVKNQLATNIFPEFTERIRFFPNIVDISDIRKNAVKPEGFEDDFNGIRLVTVARLHPQKGLDVAISAFSKLVKMGYDNIKWYIIGDGMEEHHLKKLIGRYNLEDRFILLGSRRNPYPYVKQCDIYIQPSRFEGLSLTLQEALILNKPCITTNFDGIPDLLSSGTDAIVISFLEENILNAIKLLIDDSKLREKIANATKNINLNLQNKIDVLYEIMDGVYWKEGDVDDIN